MAVPHYLIYHRHSAYEPSTTHYVPSGSVSDPGIPQDLAFALADFHAQDVTLSRWEFVDSSGAVADGGILAVSGTLLSDFDSFTDCTHVTWASAGLDLPSGIYIPGRNDQLWSHGTPTVTLASAMAALVALYRAISICDSNGLAITGYKRVTTSRRPRMRLAA